MIQANRRSPIVPMAPANIPPPLAGTKRDGRLPQRKKKGAGNGRKRSAEPRPHPPHLLNKRYWDDVKAGRTRPPPSAAALDPMDNMPTKKAKLEPAVGLKQQQQPKPVELANKKRRNVEAEEQHSPSAASTMPINANGGTDSVRSSSTNNNNGPSTASCHRLTNGTHQPPNRHAFPPPPPSSLFPPNLAQKLPPLCPPAPPGLHHFLPPPPALLTASRFLPPPPPFMSHHPIFSAAPPSPPPFMHPPPISASLATTSFHHFPFSSFGHQQMALGNAAFSLFAEILRKQQMEGGGGRPQLEEVGDVGTTGNMAMVMDQQNAPPPSTSSSQSDEQIDRLLDEMLAGRMDANHRGRRGGGGEQRICIVPVPILVPIPLPLSTQFVLDHFGPGKQKP